MNLLKHKNAAELLANKLAEIIKAAINTKGFATLVVSGGSTPKQMLIELFSIKLEWHKVTLFFSDERYVPLMHNNSNHKMVSQCLKQAGLTINLPTLISYFTPTSKIDKAVEVLEIKLLQINDFDAVVIGMGLDGHFASLFPDDEELDQKLLLKNSRQCFAVSTKSSPFARISLSLSCLLKTEYFYMLIAGEEKLAVLENAKHGIENSKLKLPITALYQTEIPDNKVQVYCQIQN